MKKNNYKNKKLFKKFNYKIKNYNYPVFFLYNKSE